MELLKQSTAATIKMGPFLDNQDGDTAEDGLNISQADIRLSKNGGDFAQTNNATGATNDENGYYGVPLDTTDTGTLGRLRVAVHESGALPVWADFLVVPANVYDSLVLGTDYLQVDVEELDGDSTAAANLNTACDNYSATRGLAGTALPAAAADAAGGLPISDDGGLDLDTQLAATNEITAARMGALTDWINGGRLDLILDGILEDTGTTLDGLIKDVPTVAEFEARTIAAADYTVVADLGTVQTGDSFAIVNGASGLVAIDGKVDDILTDTGTTLQGELDAIQAAVITNAAGADIAADIIALKAETADILADTDELQGDTHTAAEVWDTTSSTLSLSFETMMDRIYRFLMNKMTITDATGTMALRNEADNGDVATSVEWVTDDDTTTTRVAVTWS